MHKRISPIDSGSRIKLHVCISLQDGTVVENSHGEEPLALAIGDGQLEPGLEQFLVGLYEGQKKRFVVSPEQGFGFPDPEAVQLLARGDFPRKIPLEPGVIVEFNTPGGDQIPGTILNVDNDKVVVDFNHPLAGRDFIFEVEILEVLCSARGV